MILKIKEKLKNQDSRTLISNFSFLTIIEISNYILPFLAIPYIVRVIGVEKYGVIAFAYAIMAILNIITDFGFKLLATKYISIHRKDIERISKYFWTVIFAQLILLLVSLFILIVLLSTLDKFNQEKMVFIYAFGMVIGNTLFPIWFFQGMEMMKYVAIFNLISRTAYTALIFIVIKNTNDYTNIPLFNSLSFILIAFTSHYFIRKRFKLRFVNVTVKEVKLLFIEGWYLFLSRISASLYTYANTILLGLLTNYTVVGTISLATTISGAIIQITNIYTNVSFPYMAKFSKNKEVMISKAKIFLKLYSGLLLTATILTFILAESLIVILFGPNKEESVLFLKVLSLLILLQPLGGFFTTYLTLKNQNKTVAKITFLTMIINFIFIFPLILLYQGLGFVAALVVVQGTQVALNIVHNKELVLHQRGTNWP